MSPEYGRTLWKSLHSFTENYAGKPSDDLIRMANFWLADFVDNRMRYGTGNCPCRTVFKALMRLVPPDLSSATSFHDWGLAVHDFVNVKLGKPRHWPNMKHPVLTARVWRAIFGNALPVPQGFD